MTSRVISPHTVVVHHIGCDSTTGACRGENVFPNWLVVVSGDCRMLALFRVSLQLLANYSGSKVAHFHLQSKR